MFEEKLEIFYKRSVETRKSLDLFVRKCEDFQKLWKYTFSSVDKCTTVGAEAKKEMKIMKVKLMNKSLKCAVIGKVSSGKSTLINALLSKKILPNGFSCRTNCFIEVKKSLNKETHIIVGNEKKHIELLKDLADDFSLEALPRGSSIELFYFSDYNPLFVEDFIIMDTPGFDDISELDDSIVDTCIKSDVIILVVSSVVGLGEVERRFIRSYQTIFSQFNVLLLYSFWDKPQSENIQRSNKMREKLLLQAKQYLEHDLQISRGNTEDRIFFISAEEKLLSLENRRGSVDQYTRNRNDEFDKFLNYLQSYVSQTSQNKRIEIAHDIYDMLEKFLREIDYCYQEIENKKKGVGEKFRNDLSILNNFNDTINTEIEASFKEAYNLFFDRSLNIIKNEDITNDQEIMEKLNCVLQELIVVTVESLKKRVIDILGLIDDDQNEHFANILKTLYLPDYLQLKNSIKNIDNNLKSIFNCFVEINRVKKIGTGLSIAGAVVGTAATFASGGILAGIVLPIPTLFGASVLGAAGAAVGGGAGGGFSNLLLSLNREAFCSFYKNEEALMKELWQKMENEIKNSYKEFLDELPLKVGCIIEPLKEEYFSLSNKLNFLKSEANRLRNKV